MKRTIIITAILAMAFTVNAQSSRSRSERSQRSEPARKEEVKRPSRSSQSVRKSSSDDNRRTRSNINRSRSSRNNDSHARYDVNRNKANRDANRAKYRSAERTDRSRSYNRTHDNSSRNSSITRTPREARDANRYSGSRNRERSRNIDRSEHRNITPGDYKPRTGHRYDVERRKYSPHRAKRVRRPVTKTYHAYKPIEYRRVHYVYRTPPRHTIIWNVGMYHEYVRLYPDYRLWYYPIGYRIHTISAYNAGSYIGEVARVYGEVYTTWYSRQTDEYYLYIGGPYPHQDFTIILEGHDARRFSRRPARFFSGRHIAATGLISIFDGKPEMFLKKRKQLEVY